VAGAPTRPRADPAALAVADAARILSRLGGREISEEMLRADLAAGAPVNPDGTLHLVHYAAWLIREMAAAGGAEGGRGA
jgi:hypothetical protein